MAVKVICESFLYFSLFFFEKKNQVTIGYFGIVLDYFLIPRRHFLRLILRLEKKAKTFRIGLFKNTKIWVIYLLLSADLRSERVPSDP